MLHSNISDFNIALTNWLDDEFMISYLTQTG